MGNQSEPPFYLVEPGGLGRRVVHLIPGTCSKPLADLWMFVSGVVIDNQMDIKILRDVGVNVAKKSKKFLMTMPRLTLSNNFAGSNVQSGKQGCRTVPDVVVGIPFNVSQAHRQSRLCPIQCLDLALLINAQHQSTVRGFKYSPTISRTF